MQTKVRELYRTTILSLPDEEQLELATLILEKVTRKPRRRDGDITKFFGMYNSGDPNSADNERIDEDLGREYGSTHEDED